MGHDANLRRFDGLAEVYDEVRPKPPAEVVGLLLRYAGIQRARMVVDLGSGTGLSSAIWRDVAKAVVGIEPNADMRAMAQQRVVDVEFRDGRSDATGLEDGGADIVTCSQSLHWMEPTGTFREVGRILRAGGVFAAYDCDWPAVVHPEVDAAYEAFDRGVRELEAAAPQTGKPVAWAKGEHLARMRESGQFKYVREVLLHSVEQADAARVVGLAKSQGGTAALLRQGIDEERLGLGELSRVAQRVMGETRWPIWFCYRVRIGVK